jgi:hypothetical protein
MRFTAWRAFAAGALGLLFCFQPVMAQVSPDQQAQALAAISDSAIRLCPATSDSSQRSLEEIKGSIDAELSGLVKKLADLGIHPSAKFEKETSQGVLQADLASVMRAFYDCRVKTVGLLLDKFVPSAAH